MTDNTTISLIEALSAPAVGAQRATDVRYATTDGDVAHVLPFRWDDLRTSFGICRVEARFDHPIGAVHGMTVSRNYLKRVTAVQIVDESRASHYETWRMQETLGEDLMLAVSILSSYECGHAPVIALTASALKNLTGRPA